MNRLEEILQHKRQEIEKLCARADEIRRAALLRNDFRSLKNALRRADQKLAVIAEVKKASPSAGVIVPNFDPVVIAREYESAGADAVSILTDEKFFQGSLHHLRDVRGAVNLPILRKDFILDEIQIAEAVAAGADAILLIVAALEQDQLTRLREAALTYQIDVLVEVHSLREMERALEAEAEIIGINNRDLTTFKVDLSVTEQLSEEVPADVIAVSESGIKSAADLKRVRDCGMNAVLIGESFLRGELSLEQIRPKTAQANGAD
jgi:indole-3-glycerol phosphate synthase